MTENLPYNLSLVFERTSNWDFGEITVSYSMLRILSLIDGQRTIAEICESLNLTYDLLFSDIQRLHELHLIKIFVPLQRPVCIKKGYYRGAAFEFAAVDPAAGVRA